MSYRILHVVGYDRSVRIENERVIIEEGDEEDWVPVEDIALIIVATPRVTFTGMAASTFGQHDIPIVFSDDEFKPSSILLPYHRTTRTETVKSQVNLSSESKQEFTRTILQAKIRGQSTNFRCSTRLDKYLKKIPQSDDPLAQEANAARVYWDYFLSQLPTEESGRKPGSSRGANALLNYGYAMATSAVHRSLAGHGLISSLGLFHKEREASAPLAYDLVEPLRPVIDDTVRDILQKHGDIPEKNCWIKELSNRFSETIRYEGKDRRLLSSIDRYVRSFAKSVRSDSPESFQPIRYQST